MRIAKSLFILAGGLASISGSFAADVECYPGFECSSTGTAKNPYIPSVRFTDSFLIDTDRRLVWSRNLYAVGDTKAQFTNAYVGRESFPGAYSRIRLQANGALIGGVGKWRLATQAEVAGLLDRLAPASVYAYFRARGQALAPRNVLAAHDNPVPTGPIPSAGVLYSNTLLGRASSRDASGAQINAYGFWLVRDLDDAFARDFMAKSESATLFDEPIEEKHLQPLVTYQLRKTTSGVETVPANPESASLAIRSNEELRFVAQYNMQPIPRGGMVAAEVVMHGLMATGQPTPLVTIKTKWRDRPDLVDPTELWAFTDGEFVGVWQLPSNARLEVPEHVARHAFNTNGTLYVSFSASYNACEFRIPELIVRYVLADKLLLTRPLP